MVSGSIENPAKLRPERSKVDKVLASCVHQTYVSSDLQQVVQTHCLYYKDRVINHQLEASDGNGAEDYT